MKPVNICMQLASQENPEQPVCIMCCFTVSNHISPNLVRECLHNAFIKAIEMGKITGQTNLGTVLENALKSVNEQLGCTSYIIQADAISTYQF